MFKSTRASGSSDLTLHFKISPTSVNHLSTRSHDQSAVRKLGSESRWPPLNKAKEHRDIQWVLSAAIRCISFISGCLCSVDEMFPMTLEGVSLRPGVIRHPQVIFVNQVVQLALNKWNSLFESDKTKVIRQMSFTNPLSDTGSRRITVI